MPETFFVHELPNGMMLLCQPMEGVASAALTLAITAGSARDPAEAEGSAAVAAEWCLRGAGRRDTRQLNDALDSLGCQHHQSVRSEHLQFSAAQLGRNLGQVLEIYADILRRPRLADETFAPCRDLIAQDLAALADEPARHCNIMLMEKFFPAPLARCAYGRAESLAAMKTETLRAHLQAHLGPNGAILAVAGAVDWDALRAQAEALFGDWSGPTPAPPEPRTPEGGFTHVPKDSAQAHVALAHQAVCTGDERHYAARMAQTVLSAGMSSRLFTEVREKRGLAYHVSTQYHSLKDMAGMFTYAGTLPERAQETFEVVVAELRHLAEGISADELARAVTQLKSALVMQGESTSARADALAGDWYHLGRLRGLAELSGRIEAVTADQVLSYVREYPARNLTILVLGPDPIDPGAVEA